MTKYTDNLDELYAQAKANRAAGNLWEVVLINDKFGQLETVDNETFPLEEFAQTTADLRNRADLESEKGQTWQVRKVDTSIGIVKPLPQWTNEIIEYPKFDPDHHTYIMEIMGSDGWSSEHFAYIKDIITNDIRMEIQNGTPIEGMSAAEDYFTGPIYVLDNKTQEYIATCNYPGTWVWKKE